MQTRNHYRILGCSRDATPEEIKQVYSFSIALAHSAKSQNSAFSSSYRLDCNQRSVEQLEAAYKTLSNPLERAAYDQRLAEDDLYFDNLYGLVTKKDQATLKTSIENYSKGGSGIAATIISEFAPPNPHLAFHIENKDGETLVQYLGKIKDRTSMDFLVKHFRDHFTLDELAFMGTPLSPEEKQQSPFTIIYHYALGNHVQEVETMLLEEKNEATLGNEALVAYVCGGNIAEAEKLAHKIEASSPPFGCALFYYGMASGGYLKDTTKLLNLLSACTPLFRKNLVKHAKHVIFTGPIRREEQEIVSKNLDLYDKIAPVNPASIDPLDLPAPNPNAELFTIFDNAIQKIQNISTPNTTSKKKFLVALSALKHDTIKKCFAGTLEKPAAKKIADATLTLADELGTADKASSAVNKFEKETHKLTRQYKMDRAWKMIFAMVIGAAIGFVLGAILGVGTGPGAAFTAIAGGAKGALITASFFGGVGAILGARIGYRAIPLADVANTAKVMQKTMPKLGST